MSIASRSLRPFLMALWVISPVVAGAEWQVVASETGKRVEIDRGSILVDPAGISMARARAPAGSNPACRRSDSPIWSPTVNTGFSEVMGS